MTEPVITIGAVFTSLKVAVVAILTVAILGAGLEQDAPLAIAITGAGSAITLALGDLVALWLTRRQVTSLASPNLPIGTVVNSNSATPTATVVEDKP